ncbi:hypothetical protein F5Y04DRAFT_170288 [Hypomontagnella monticulosa]|nr:hypothetical protein F5Y04DRAFT_170288 [Hypomontagnella monticulosa]
MHLTLPSPLALLTTLLLVSPIPQTAASKPKNAILLSDVQTLTLRGNGAKTAHRRVSAIPQLRCVSSPSICRLHAIDVMRCVNQGSGYDSEDVQWSCSASLPPELKLGSTEVMCEGYASSEDPYILKGSCGVEYRLALTDVGERKFPEIANGGGGWGRNSYGGNGGGKGSGTAGAVFFLVFAGVCIWILYNACVAGGRNNIRLNVGRRPRRTFWGGGGGFDPGFGPGGGGGGWGDWKSSSTQGEGWRPGFWSGVAGGAAAGYMAGNRGNNRRERDDGYGWGAGPSTSSFPSRSSSRSTSSARYESTGFGSTSRR